MEKRVVLFIIIAAVMLGASILIPQWIQGPKPQVPVASASPKPSIAPEKAVVNPSPSIANTQVAGLVDGTKAIDIFVGQPDQSLTETSIELSSNLFKLTFSNKGGNLNGVELFRHKDGENNIQMLYAGAKLSTKIGGSNGQETVDLFNYKKIDDNTIEFSKTYVKNNNPNNSFTLKKTYSIKPSEYIVQLKISILNSNLQLPLEFTGNGREYFTLELGNQIGPINHPIDNFQDFRRLVYLTGNDSKNIQQANYDLKPDESFKWAAIDGKYYTFIIIPSNSKNTLKYSIDNFTPKYHDSKLAIIEKSDNASAQIDSTYNMYIGPKLLSSPSGDDAKSLSDYDNSNTNGFALQGLKINNVVDHDFFNFWWLAVPLKWIMDVFHMVIPNWGIAIILLTILIKFSLYPLSKKGMKSSARLQELAPKMAALKEKHKDNPQKLNMAMAELYQKEKINPLSGCLPLLLQLPFFFAMYTLFNTNFDLRGAAFIPGWINDLTAPESILKLPFTIPFVNISDLRLLPIIYLTTQLLSSEFTPQAATQSTTQAKIFKYVLPIVFFFILYNTSSGLLVFWIFQNVFTIIQQILTNRSMAKKKALEVTKGK